MSNKYHSGLAVAVAVTIVAAVVAGFINLHSISNAQRLITENYLRNSQIMGEIISSSFVIQTDGTQSFKIEAVQRTFDKFEFIQWARLVNKTRQQNYGLKENPELLERYPWLNELGEVSNGFLEELSLWVARYQLTEDSYVLVFFDAGDNLNYLKKSRMILGFQILLVLIAAGLMILAIRSIRHFSRQQVLTEQLETYREANSRLEVAARSFAHEIKNPLNSISLALQRMKYEGVSADSGVLDITLGELSRINTHCENFLSVMKLSVQEPQLVDLSMLLEELAGYFRFLYPDVQLELSKECQRPAELLVNREGLVRCLQNLLKNAAEAVGARGRVRLLLLADQRTISLVIEDSGPGIAVSERENIFQLYYSGKESSGIGLYLVKNFVSEAGGTINVSSAQLGGARFTVRFPVAD